MNQKSIVLFLRFDFEINMAGRILRHFKKQLEIFLS